ncbi:hypothetical protein LMG6871_02487 [Ralstonia edaphis]|uniref:hypothetical protein n=1 Tax=Ralstonia edaphi TaxID=3058599 RepID=UPI0028F634C0|nr:hypothetical protein [Ralstonia sp. LMG 6871]CAJ0718527.1 hypothetical protein LMG6871_02487 [Ralstonia sp. LMG 6871]
MSQNLISFQLSATDVTAIDGALKTLEEKLVGLIGLSTEQRSKLMKMGHKSEAFCREALELLSNNPGVLPGNFSLQEMRRDLTGFDTLRPRVARMDKLLERMRDSQLAMGSDLMSAALEGYTYLKVAGKGEGLEGARRVLSTRFSRRPRKKAEETAQ